MELINPVSVSVILGGLAKPLITLIIQVFEKNREVTKLHKKIITILVCTVLGLLITLGENKLIDSVTAQDMIINLAIVIATSQTIHGFLKREE